MITVIIVVANNFEKRNAELKNLGEILKYKRTPAIGINSG